MANDSSREAGFYSVRVASDVWQYAFWYMHPLPELCGWWAVGIDRRLQDKDIREIWPIKQDPNPHAV